MRKLCCLLIVGGLLFFPTISNAVVFTFSFDLQDILVSTSGAGGTYRSVNISPGASLTGNAAAATLTIPQGSSFLLGEDISLSGSNQFGIGGYGVGLTDSHPTVAAVNASAGNGTSDSQRVGYGSNGNHGPNVNPFFVSANTNASTIYTDNAGGVDAKLGIAGYCVIAALSNQTPYLYYGDNAPAELFNGLQIDSMAQ